MFSATVLVSLCFSKQLLDSVFAISVIIEVSLLVFKHVPALAGKRFVSLEWFSFECRKTKTKVLLFDTQMKTAL